MFENGEFVVYGQVGICQIKDITTMNMEGVPKDRLYYVLQPVSKSEGTIYTPVENSKRPIRRVMTKEEAENLISEIPEIETLKIENEKQREEKYKECLKNSSGREMVRIIKTIYGRMTKRIENGKKVTAVDERYMKMAEETLYSELSMLLGIPKDKMVSYITQKIASH